MKEFTLFPAFVILAVFNYNVLKRHDARNYFKIRLSAITNDLKSANKYVNTLTEWLNGNYVITCLSYLISYNVLKRNSESI